MNGKRAKALRRLVYGDYALRDRKYVGVTHGNGPTASLTVVAHGRRRAYQALKKHYARTGEMPTKVWRE